MNAEKEKLQALWAAIDEKARLQNAAGLLLYANPESRNYVRPMIALVCTLALCLLPMVSAGEEAYAVVSRLAW